MRTDMPLVERIHGLPRGPLRVLGVLGLAVVLLLAGQTSASASLWQWSDDFEGNPASTWSFDWGGQFEINQGAAMIGKNDALLANPSNFYSVGANIHLTPAQLHKSQCAASVYVSPFGPAKVNFEIINPSNWNYIALKSVTLTGSGYQQIKVGPWTPGPIDVRLRVSLVSGGGYSAIRVDNVVVQCSYS